MFISFRLSVLHPIDFLWSMLAFLLMMTRLLIAGAENAQVYGEIYYITDIELVLSGDCIMKIVLICFFLTDFHI